MTWNPEIKQFIADHLQDDTARLLFSAHRFPGVDVPFAVEQIEARRRLKNKLPEWYANPDLVMGGRIPAEQCSSEQTARYKHSLVEGYHSLCDMTGGMGVDFWYMSRGMDEAIYSECQPHLCEAASHNFAALSASSADARPVISVREGVSTQMPVPDVDVIYLDPARRSDSGSRIYEIEDCIPNVIAWQDELLSHCKRLITKVSPMADVSRTLQRLRDVLAVHIVSVRNECKELLIVQKGGQDTSLDPSAQEVIFHCVDFLAKGTVSFSFCQSALSVSTDVPIVSALSDMHYLYEPDVSLMKAQAFAPLAHKFPVQMVDVNTHLFVSDQVIPDFPGRSFVIDQLIEFSSRQLKQLKRQIPQANIATRNFVLSPEELRSRSGIREGGSVYLFGCQAHQLGAVLLSCHKLD